MMDLHKEEPVVGGMIQHIAHAMFKETNRDLLQYNLTGVQANVLVYLFFHEKESNSYRNCKKT